MAADSARASGQPLEVDPAISDALMEVYDPCCRDRGVSVVDMGLLHRARVEDGVARVELLLTSGWCPFASRVLTEVERAVMVLPGVEDAQVDVVWDEAWGPHRLSDSARSKLRFLPDPAVVADPRSYVEQHWPQATGGTR
jgi:metal-sulfur cluster biosynthetic enzyme